MDNNILAALESITEILDEKNDSKVPYTIDTSPDRFLKPYEEAEIEYERIRNSVDDISNISFNIDKELEIVERVKNHIFFLEHTITYQDNSTKVGRLDPDPCIVNAWDRLSNNEYISSDLVFFDHEEYESMIEKAESLTYNEAHRRTIEAGYIWNPEEE